MSLASRLSAATEDAEQLHTQLEAMSGELGATKARLEEVSRVAAADAEAFEAERHMLQV